MSSMLQPLKKIINETTSEFIDSEVSNKIAGVMNTFIDSVFGAVDDTLLWVQEVTEEQEEEPEEEEPEEP